jgi:hypothetical protein
MLFGRRVMSKLKQFIKTESEFWNREVKAKEWMAYCLMAGNTFLVSGFGLGYLMFLGIFLDQWVKAITLVSVIIFIGVVLIAVYVWYEVKLNPRVKAGK